MDREISFGNLEKNEFYLETKRKMLKDICWFYTYGADSAGIEKQLREKIEWHRKMYLGYALDCIRTEDYLWRQRELAQRGHSLIWSDVLHLGMEMLRHNWLHQSYLAHLAATLYFERMLEDHLEGDLDLPF